MCLAARGRGPEVGETPHVEQMSFKFASGPIDTDRFQTHVSMRFSRYCDRYCSLSELSVYFVFVGPVVHTSLL